jgi:hypothetical protein
MHGAREVFTFTFLAVLPSYAININLEVFSVLPASIVLTLIITAIIAYYVWIYLRVDVRNLARGDFEIPYLLASHFFEHLLDYAYIALLVGLLISF